MKSTRAGVCGRLGMFVHGGRFGAGKGSKREPGNCRDWLGRRDSNPDTQIQSLQSYR